MYKCKHGTGFLPIGNLIRLPVGTSIIYEVAHGQAMKFEVFAQSYCKRVGARINQEQLFAHNGKGESFHLVKITVVESALPLKKKGRKKGQKAINKNEP